MQKNPFDLPNMGFNQENPLFTSMNMMRQMWEGMGTNPMDMSTAATAIPSAEDLEKRIKELKTVENWLRLNLSMLSSTIQGLEIQRSTLSTLQSFAQGGLAAMPGLTEAMSAATMQTMSQTAAPSLSKEKETDKDSETSKPKQAKTEENPQEEQADATEHLMQAGQAWWNLMQEQFDALAKSTTQSIQQAQPPISDFASAVGNPSADTTFGKAAATKKTAKKATKTAAKKSASKATKSTATKAAKATKKTPPPPTK